VQNLKTLEAELEQIQNRNGGVNYSREKESSMYLDDLSDLKKRVSEYETYIKRLKELVDNDKAEELIDELSSNDERKIDLNEIKN
jgi:DNA repair exonuclease SbcCD ATPase subunit